METPCPKAKNSQSALAVPKMVLQRTLVTLRKAMQVKHQAQNVGAKQLFAGALFVMAVAMGAFRVRAPQRDCQSRTVCEVFDPRPTLSFGPSGLLLAYYHGICTFLKDHFHLEPERVRVAGISGGAICSFHTIGLGINAADGVKVGMRMRARILARALLCYLIKPDVLVEMLETELRAVGVTDATVLRMYKAGSMHFGVTSIANLAHRCVPAGRTLRETLKLVCASSCILPFLREPVQVPAARQARDHGKTVEWAVDGIFSGIHTIPAGSDPQKTVRLSAWPLTPNSDVSPPWYQMPILALMAVIPLPLCFQVWLFSVGYRDMAARQKMLQERGLVLRIDAKNRLEQHKKALVALKPEDFIPTGCKSVRFSLGHQQLNGRSPGAVCMHRGWSSAPALMAV